MTSVISVEFSLGDELEVEFGYFEKRQFEYIFVIVPNIEKI